jgi:hypothetical protein
LCIFDKNRTVNPEEFLKDFKTVVGEVSLSVKSLTDEEHQRLQEWLSEPKREPAQTKFTAGALRDIAREIEYRERKGEPS